VDSALPCRQTYEIRRPATTRRVPMAPQELKPNRPGPGFDPAHRARAEARGASPLGRSTDPRTLPGQVRGPPISARRVRPPAASARGPPRTESPIKAAEAPNARRRPTAPAATVLCVAAHDANVYIDIRASPRRQGNVLSINVSRPGPRSGLNRTLPWRARRRVSNDVGQKTSSLENERCLS
jgi:hypothetical protein